MLDNIDIWDTLLLISVCITAFVIVFGMWVHLPGEIRKARCDKELPKLLGMMFILIMLTAIPIVNIVMAILLLVEDKKDSHVPSELIKLCQFFIESGDYEHRAASLHSTGTCIVNNKLEVIIYRDYIRFKSKEYKTDFFDKTIADIEKKKENNAIKQLLDAYVQTKGG